MTTELEIDLRATTSEPEALALMPESYAMEKKVMPLRIEDDTLLIAAHDLDPVQIREIQVLTRHRIRVVRASLNQIEFAIRDRYGVLARVDQHVQEFSERTGIGSDLAAAAQIGDDSPVVQIANLLITQGLRDRASDIHIEPQQTRLRVRFRIDGILKDALDLPRTMAPALASRIKVMANMDIVDRHRSQDGQIRIEGEGRQVDIRVSTAETIWGEKVVMRLLDQGRTLLKLDELGLAEQPYHRLSALLRSPYGMIVVSGPTGSGKTTTLYGAIRELDASTQNITTIEDPVEYTFEDINQMQIRRMANLTFANGLKAILRQDPDVILVGEIRDLETAEIAIQSALTGHLVLSSLHATDAAGVIQRFIEMGIEGFLISSALVGVLGQRLVRRICRFCPEPYQPSAAEMRLWEEFRPLDKEVFYRGAGCDNCAGTGYRGRVGVFEVLPLSETIKRMISDKASSQAIREQAMAEGMATLRSDAVSKVAADMTTLSEVMRCVWLI
ncbi:MAG TPA: GspE/PulE family protein [Candidatus Dormibacteraeota bacterium]|nr:GspE/PulE family protein [Candidatus Dormibacteraeota bacterium]